MKKIFTLSNGLLCGMLLLMTTSFGFASAAIENTQITDVTPSGFSVVWQTSDPASPGISIFSDAGGTQEITRDLEVVAFPVHSGDPDIAEEYFSDVTKDDVKALSRAANMVKISVSGCTPDTVYHVKISASDSEGTSLYPETGLMAVTTARENAFIKNARQLLITLSNDAGDLAADGWIVTAAAPDMSAPVSGFVGDGAGANQAVLNLSNFFDTSGNNWTPEQVEILDIAVRLPGQTPLPRSVSVDFSADFTVADLVVLDVNVDEQPDITPPEVAALPPGGTYYAIQTITLSANEAADIFYTLDGTDPHTGSSLYIEPITVADTTVLKFFGLDTAGNASDIVTAAYAIVANAPPYEPSAPVPATNAANVSVKPRLEWQGGDPDAGDTVTYDVQFKTDTGTFAAVCTDIAETFCELPLLSYSAAYQWQVTATDSENQSTAGPVWQFTTFGRDGDADNDGLSNEMEITLETDPFHNDTDRDGYKDGEEFYVGSDPLDARITPPYPPGYGDLDQDADIDGKDVFILMSVLYLTADDEGFNPRADFNGDGVIDALDVEMFARVYGYMFDQPCDPAADFDADGDVDGVDIRIFSTLLGLDEFDPGFDPRADFNGDGLISEWDFPFFVMNLGCSLE